jgi:uncharacterized damage-inducible protein DinB
MSDPSPIASMLADMVKDSSHGNRWHCLKEATAGIRPKDLTHKPVRVPWGWGKFRRNLATLRGILVHTCNAAETYGDHLGPRTRAKVEGEWDASPLKKPFDDPRALIRPTDIALRRMHARAARMTDDELTEPCGLWENSPKLFAIIDGGILHTSWHLGQVAQLIMMSQAREKERMAGITGPASRAPVYPGARDWSDCRVKSRTDACLRLLDAAYRESPFHAIRRMCTGLTRGETVWRPFPKSLGFVSIEDRMRHVAYCKIMYGNHAFGDRRMDWGDCDAVVGLDLMQERGPRKLVTALDRAQEYLLDRVAAASDKDLDRRNRMHHRVPHTGWQVVASMAEHDAWHGGQISILRDSYAALAEKGA